MNDASFFKSVKPEQFIDALLDISPDALLLVDPDFRIIRANPMALELLEISGEDLSNTSLLNHFSSAKSRLKRLSARVQKNGEGTVGRLRLSVNPDRKTNFHITAKLIEAGGSEVMLLTCSDSTEPSPAEKKLKESEEKFSTLLQNMHEGVMLVDNDDRIQYVNDRIMTMLGYDRDELVGEVGYRILFSEEYQKIIQEKNRLRTKRVADTYEVEMLANGGETLWVQISGAPIVDAAGKVVGSFGILTDITERKASEAALQSAKSELEKRVKERTRELTAMNDSLMREIYERKQVEEERQKFFSLVENSSDLIVMADPDSGKLIYANKAALRALGQSQKGSLDRQTIFDCHPADLQERLATEILPSITEAGNWHGELPFFNNESGEELPTLFNGFAVKHPLSDDLIAIAIIYRDVRELKNQEAALQVAKNELETRVQERTAELSEANQILMQQIVVRRRAEEELQNSEEKYRLLFNSGNDSVFAFHAESNGELSNFIEVNDVACQKLGYGREELLALSMRSIVIGYRQEDMKGRLRRLLSEQHILFEETFLTRAGVAIPMEISAHLFTFRDRPTIMAIARDITNRKRAETQIRDQAALLDKAQDAIMVCDLNDYVIYWNKSAERLYGWKNQEAIGNNAFELLFQRDSTQYISSRRAVLEHGEWLGELHQVTKEGREILVESRWTLVHDNTGEAKSILVVNTDITEKKLIEVQFLRAQRMESIGALAGGIAHDLNNVLAPILTAVQILQVRFTDDKSEKILNTIESNVKRGADMVKQILTFARGVEGERIPLHIQHLIHDLEKITLETFPKSITIHLDIASDLWPVSGDSTQLQQVLLNLCVNARDAMPKGGELVIEASNVNLEEEFARVQLEANVGPYVLVRVSDSGSGIPASIINKIFEPFFTTKEPGKGTGLGLSTVIAIVKSHGGFVKVESALGRGTDFEVYLPASTELESEDLSDGEGLLPHGNGETILLVDDESSILDITRETLETYGYKVITARDGAEAVGLFAQHKAVIDAVITDIMMPVMDGPTAIRNLRKMKSDLKVVASSGFVEEPKVKELIADGVQYFLHKPYTADKVLEVLAKLFAEESVKQESGDEG